MDELIPVIPLVDTNHRTSHQHRTNATSARDVSSKHVSFAPAPGKKLDPDVQRMMETGSSNFNVTALPHKKTEEEKEVAATQGGVAGTSSWVIIVMAVVVILLICAIVYLVLKYNETCDPPPNNLLESLKRKRGEVVKIPPQLQPRMTQAQAHAQARPQDQARPVLKPSTQNLNLAQQQEMQNQQNKQNQQKSKGTKEELMKMLKTQPQTTESKLEPISENPEKDPDPMKPLKMPDQEKPTEADSDMINDFYHQMDMNAEDEGQPLEHDE